MITEPIRKIMKILPDRLYIMIQYFYHFKRFPNLKEPRTFNEKLQWLKLNDRNPIYTTMVDKVLAKAYVASIIGKEHIVPTLGVWDSAEDIDFEALPDRFVLKTNHDSKGVVICADKAKLNIPETRAFLDQQLRTNGYWYGREWPYKNVKKKILAEEYLESPNGDLIDYKLMCFNGKVKCSLVCSDRFTGKGMNITFFDRDWVVLPFERGHPALREGFPKPSTYEEMVRYAEALSKKMYFARIDFYEVKGQVYFGEITLYPGSGLKSFQPEEWDLELGRWLDLSSK